MGQQSKAKIQIETGAAQVLAQLHKAGCAAYVVGGCVRDALLGQTPHDWDICTSARPEQVMELFGEKQCIPTGLKHGTVTVKQNGGLYEVTTFRTESAYSDGRHPDAVAFVTDVREDLARRDFTVNAMAYNDAEGLIDPFGGEKDLLQNHCVRAVGDPTERFEEDALRILRLLRFAARLEFAMEPQTLAAACAAREKLGCVSAERQREELSKLLCTPCPSPWLVPEIVGVILPELLPCIGFETGQWEQWMHILHTVDTVPPEEAVRFAALLHEVAKPQMQPPFDGCAVQSAAVARTMLHRLKASNELTETVCLLIEQNDFELPDDANALRRTAKHLLHRMGAENLYRLTELHAADCIGQSEAVRAKRLWTTAEAILQAGECYTTKQLAVSGRDLMKELTLPAGRAVGELLAELLEQVLDEQLPNERDALLDAARQIYAEKQNAQ